MQELVILKNVEEAKMFPKSRCGGYIYALLLEGKVKIGRTTNPYQRLKDISHMSGKRLEKVCVSVDCYNHSKLENILHKHFKAHRIIGEWFNVDFDEALAEMQKLQYLKTDRETDDRIQTEASERVEKFTRNLFKREKAELMDWHCIHCCCPKAEYVKSMNTYAGDECELYSDFIDRMQRLERGEEFSNQDVIYAVHKMLVADNLQPQSMESITEELIAIYEDLVGMPSNYVPALRKIS